MKIGVILVPAALIQLAPCCKEILHATRQTNRGMLFLKYKASLRGGDSSRKNHRHAYEIWQIWQRYDGMKVLVTPICGHNERAIEACPFVELDNLLGEARKRGKEQELKSILTLLALAGNQ